VILLDASPWWRSWSEGRQRPGCERVLAVADAEQLESIALPEQG
jgi:hypothetical protein